MTETVLDVVARRLAEADYRSAHGWRGVGLATAPGPTRDFYYGHGRYLADQISELLKEPA